MPRAARRSSSRRRCTLALAALLLVAACAPYPRRPVPPVEPREPLVDILDYEIHLDVHHEAGYVSGLVAVEFAALEGLPATTLLLDAVALDVHDVRDSAGRELAVVTSGDTVAIALAQPLAPGATEIVTLAYDAFPRRGLYMIPPSPREPEGSWSLWTQGETEDTRHWVPVWDIPNDRATHTLNVTVDDRFLTMAAGDLVDSRRHPSRGRRTDTWRIEEAHVSYLLTLVAGDLEQRDLGDGRVPLPVVAESDDMELALANTERTADILRYLGEVIGRDYPYSKYSQAYVRDYTAGGMENISATTLYYEGIHDPADEPQVDILGLVAHEIAHQWFGDLITCAGWGDLWLNEGFADYYEARYLGHLRGPDHFRALLVDYQRLGMEAELADSRPIVWHDYEDPDDTFDGHAYSAAAARLHLLSDQLGMDDFERAVRAWVERAEDTVAVTADLVDVFEDELGRELDDFFDQWFYGAGYPIFDVAAETRDGAPVLVAVQVQDEDHDWRSVFDVDVDVTWSRGGVVHTERLSVDERREEVPLTGDGELDWFHFDSRTVVPGEVRARQDEDGWRRQLSARAALSRLRAAEWFAGDEWTRWQGTPEEWSPASPSVDVLLDLAADDDFIDVRVAAVLGLSWSDDERVAPALRRLARDDDPRVRENALLALGYDPSERDLEVLRSAVDDPNHSVVVAAVTGLVDARHGESFDLIQDIVASTPKVRLARDLVALAPTAAGREALPFLMGVARRHPERWVRVAAVEALGTHRGRHRDAVFRQLCASLNEDSYSVRAAAARALEDFGDERALLHLKARRDIEIDPTVLDAVHDAIHALS